MSADACNVYTDEADISVWLQGFELLATVFIFIMHLYEYRLCRTGNELLFNILCLTYLNPGNLLYTLSCKLQTVKCVCVCLLCVWFAQGVN